MSKWFWWDLPGCFAVLINFIDFIFRSVHLSNVAVQENYLNGKRSDKLPENNFMTSEQFVEYLRFVSKNQSAEHFFSEMVLLVLFIFKNIYAFAICHNGFDGVKSLLGWRSCGLNRLHRK